MSIFYLDFELGNDFPDLLTGVVFTDSGGNVLGTKVGHGLVTGDVRMTFNLQGNAVHYSNGIWTITRINDDTFTLDGAVWASFAWWDQTGDMCSLGGSTWATAWKTITGASASRTAPGDTIRIAKTDDAAALGVDLIWTRGQGFIKTGLKIGRFDASWLQISEGVSGYTQPYYGFFDALDLESGVNVLPTTAFTTGRCVAHNLAAPLDLSGYDKLSIWGHGSMSYVAGDFSIELYDEVWGPTLTSIGFSNPSSTIVEAYAPSHPFVTGDQVVVSGCTQAYANTKWTITKTGANNFTLDGAVWASFNGADNTGTVRLENVVPNVLATLVSTEGINVDSTLQEFRWSFPDPAALAAVKSIVFVLNQDRGALPFLLSSCYAYNSIPGTLEVSRMDDLARTSEWTAAADVTLTNVAASQAIMRGMRMAIASGFTTGPMAYKNYASGQDWSSYKYVSCLCYHSGLPETSVLQLLIDDTVNCASPLETISAPFFPSYTHTWVTFRLADPGALTSVRSIGFSVTADPGSVNFQCYAMFLSTGYTGDSLLSNALTGPDWYATNLFAGSNWWSHGITGGSTGIPIIGKTTVTEAGYYRKPFLRPYSETSRNIVQESGTAGNLITFSGGWNRDDTTQDGQTWMDAGSGYSQSKSIQCDNKAYIRLEGICFVRSGATGLLGTVSYPLDYCQFDIPYIGYSYSASGSYSIQFGSGSTGQDIVIGTAQHNAQISFGYGAFDAGYRNSMTIARMVEQYNDSIGVMVQGVDNEVIIGTILGWAATSNYPIHISSAQHCRVTVTGDIIAGPNYSGPAINIASGEYNYVLIGGDILCRDSGVSNNGAIRFYNGYNNVVTFTKTGAVISRSSYGLCPVGNGKGNMVANVIMQNCTYDAYFSGLEEVELILQYCGISAAKIYCQGYGKGYGWIKCHHFNQTLDDHRTYYAGYTAGTPGAVAIRNTADADADDCIQLTFNANFNNQGEVLIPVGWFLLTGATSHTVSVKMKKSADFNGRVPAIGIVGEGVQAHDRSTTALTTSYQTYSLTFTPPRTQYARLLIMVDGTLGSVYIDTLTVS